MYTIVLRMHSVRYIMNCEHGFTLRRSVAISHLKFIRVYFFHPHNLLIFPPVVLSVFYSFLRPWPVFFCPCKVFLLYATLPPCLLLFISSTVHFIIPNELIFHAISLQIFILSVGAVFLCYSTYAVQYLVDHYLYLLICKFKFSLFPRYLCLVAPYWFLCGL